MQSVSSRIWTRAAVFISYDDNNYTTGTSLLHHGHLLITPRAPPYFFIICLDYVLRTSIDTIKENGFKLTKERSRRYPAQTITDADHANDITLLAYASNQAETLLHSQERAAASKGPKSKLTLVILE